MNVSKIPVTVLVQTKNEQTGISKCLEGLLDFDEVIVVDSESTDQTKEIANQMGIKTVNFVWNHKYPKKKQWQLDELETKHNWILFMDADEVPTPELINELQRTDFNGSTNTAAYDICLDYVFAGRKLKHGHRVVKRALVNRRRVEFPVINDLDAPGMGELEGHYQPVAHGLVVRTLGRILHDDQDPIRTWFDRHNRYSDWEAYLRTKSGLRKEAGLRRSTQGRLFDRTPFKPLVFFIYSYIAKQGIRDGRAGFDYAFALSSYYWQIELKVRERNQRSAKEGQN